MMTRPTFPETMPQNSVLTDKQRKYLRASDSEREEDYTKQQRSYHWNNIRERIWRALRDFDLLSEELTEEERRMMLEVVMEDSPLTKAGDTDAPYGAESLFPGVIAFLYQQEDNPTAFEEAIEKGINRAVERDGWFADVAVKISVEETHRVDNIGFVEDAEPLLDGEIPDTMTRSEYDQMVSLLRKASMISSTEQMRAQAFADKHDFAED